MPTHKRVSDIYEAELTNRSPERMEMAGRHWRAQLQGFYFPGSEDVIDQCALDVLKIALEEEGRTPTEQVRRRVRTQIGIPTVTSGAIDIVFLAAAQPRML